MQFSHSCAHLHGTLSYISGVKFGVAMKCWGYV